MAQNLYLIHEHTDRKHNDEEMYIQTRTSDQKEKGTGGWVLLVNTHLELVRPSARDLTSSSLGRSLDAGLPLQIANKGVGCAGGRREPIHTNVRHRSATSSRLLPYRQKLARDETDQQQQ